MLFNCIPENVDLSGLLIVDLWTKSGVIGLLFVNLLIDPCGFMWIAIKIKLDRPSCWFEYNSSVAHHSDSI